MNIETNDQRQIQAIPTSSAEERTAVRQTGAWIDILVKALAVFVPILYALGCAYAHGYYQALGLSSSLMGFAFEHYLYIGYVGISNSIATVVGFASLPVLIGVVIVVALALLTRYLGSWLSRLNWKAPPLVSALDKALQHFFHADHLPRLRKVLSLPMTLVGAMGIGWLFFIALLLFLVIPVAAMQSYGGHEGEAEWENYRKAWQSNANSKLGLITYKGDAGNEHSALLVECSVEWCAVFRDGKFSAIRTSTILEISRADHAKTEVEKAPSAPDKQ